MRLIPCSVFYSVSIVLGLNCLFCSALLGSNMTSLKALPVGEYSMATPQEGEDKAITKLIVAVTQNAEQQDEDMQDGETQEGVAQEGDKEDGKPEDAEETIVELPKAEVNQKEIRLHMFDGTVITGEMSTEILTISTEFGSLEIPIEKVVQVSPGLDSYPQIVVNLDELIEKLGAADYNVRQAARKELSAMGLKIKNELEKFSDQGNAERKKHLDELKKEISASEMDMEDFDDNPIKPYIRGDSVKTPDFTVVGKIQQTTFVVKSKYGDLTVQLQDVQMIDRQTIGSEEIRRVVTVSGSNFIQSNVKSSGIKVNKGDVISITATGSITMTPWGGNRTSSPDGSTNYGWYVNNKIEGGALCVKIGDSGTEIKIGSKHRFTATKSGVLKFGIGMQQAYAGGNYEFPGDYKVKVIVAAGNN